MKYWVCDKCLPEEVEELAIGALFMPPCIICGKAMEPNEMKCVRSLPERLMEKILIKSGDMIKMEFTVGKEPDSVQVDAALPLADGYAKDIEDMRNRIVAAMMIPKEYLEPALTGHASLLVAMDKETSKMTKETAEHAKETIEKIIKVK